jgi:hypothetical protein
MSKASGWALVLEIGAGLALQHAVRAAIDAAAKVFAGAGATIEPVAPFLNG